MPKVSPAYNLQTENPALAKEWHSNNNINLTPCVVLPGSKKKVWWLCKKGHEWEARIANRHYLKRGCPYCSGQKVNDENCLQTKNPRLAKEWHPTKNRHLTPLKVTSGSEKKVWWRCKKGHEWEAQILGRNQGNGCPYCSGRFATAETSLFKIPGTQYLIRKFPGHNT